LKGDGAGSRPLDTISDAFILTTLGDCKPVMTFMGFKIKNAHLNPNLVVTTKHGF
jgi:hypothetical protein